MRSLFVRNSNVDRFLAGVDAVEQRGAPEASIQLVSGDAGLGKSRTLKWWHTHNDSVLIRVKAACTPHWVLKDLVTQLGEQAPAHSCEKLFGQVVGCLVKLPEPLPIIVDEVEHTLRNDIRSLEILRDVSDTAEVPLILVGREYVRGDLKRHKAVYTRISHFTEFRPASEADVALAIRELCEVPVAEDMAPLLRARSEGRMRAVVEDIKSIERVGKRNKGAVVDAAAMGWKAPRSESQGPKTTARAA